MFKPNYLYLSLFVAGLVNATEMTIDENTEMKNIYKNSSDNSTMNFNKTPNNQAGGFILIAGNKENNTLNINSDLTNGRSAFGAKSDSDAVSGNVVNINNGTIFLKEQPEIDMNGKPVLGEDGQPKVIEGSGNLYGGYAFKDATNNTVNINNGDMDIKKIFGGYVGIQDAGAGTKDAGNTGNAINNKTVINNGNININAQDLTDRKIFGGWSDTGDGIGNTLTINNGNIKAEKLHGGGGQHSASGNAITINGGKVEDASIINGGFSYDADATNNSLTITGGEIKIDGELSAGHSQSANAINNIVKISGGKITSANSANIQGGNSSKGNANNNLVVISDGDIGVNVHGGYSSKKDAVGNTLNISGGKFSNTDETKVSVISGGYAAKGNVKNNVINISGGTFANEKATAIYAGYVEDLAKSNVTNNVINLNADNLVLAKLYGVGYKNGDFITNNAQTSGNTLNVTGKNITAFSAQNFNNINFYITKNFDMANDVMLKLNTNNADDLDFSKTNIGINITGGTTVKNDDVIKLINTPNGNINKDPANLGDKVAGLTGMVGTLVYDFTIEKPDNQNIVAKATFNKDGTEISKNILETSVAEMGALSNSADLLSDIDLDTIAKDNVWGAIKGSEMRYKSGSHVDVDNFSAAVGASKAINNHYLGAFVELGGGKFDSFNSINFANPINITSVSGKGNFKYYGFGLRGDFNFANDFYAKSTLRAGQIKTDYSNSLDWAYESTRNYFGGSLELGKKLNITDTSSIDLYTKGFYTRLNKANVNVIGDDITLNKMDSIRARAGATYFYKADDKVETYLGVALERELKGDAKGYNKTNAVDISNPSVKGSTGIVNLGIKADVTDKLNVDLKLEGTFGKREGIAGGIVATYKL